MAARSRRRRRLPIMSQRERPSSTIGAVMRFHSMRLSGSRFDQQYTYDHSGLSSDGPFILHTQDRPHTCCGTLRGRIYVRPLGSRRAIAVYWRLKYAVNTWPVSKLRNRS